MKLIKDPVHGYIVLTEAEAGIVDTYAFQRLRRINQLPLVYLVYPGARHSRFDHSLGSLFLASEFARHLGLEEHDASVLKTAALLHDIGHAPYSHLLESLLLEAGKSHEDVSIEIIREDPELSSAVEKTGVEMREIIDVLEGRSKMSGLVSGPLDVDRLDFLVRDAYFTGATYGVIDVRRIIHLTRLDEEGPSVDVRGMGAVEELAMARHHSFMNIYFHHAVRAAQVLFLRGVEEIAEEGLDFASMSTSEYLSHDDYSVWCMMRSDPRSRWVIERIERRRLPKRVFEDKLGVESRVAATLRDRREIEQRIAAEAGVDQDLVFVDSSLAPPLSKFGAEGVRLHSEAGKPVSPNSWILEMVSRPLQIVRVYVDGDPKEAERVRAVSEALLTRR